MKSIRIITLVLLAIVSTGCIENDIPYPVIVSNITDFEVDGQLEPPVIDTKNRKITVQLADTVDLANVRLVKFVASNEPTVTPEPTSYIDLSKNLSFTLTTYQDYVWTIEAVQQMDRYITVENQIGEAIFNVREKQALIYVPQTQSLADIHITAMQLGPTGSTILPDYTGVTDFRQAVTFVSVYKNRSEIWKVIAVHSEQEVVTGTSNPWATRVHLTGSYIAGGAAPGFEYRVSGTESWQSTQEVEISGTTFNGWVRGLSPGTTYQYRAFSGSNYGSIDTFRTEDDIQVPNMSFDDWTLDGKILYPNADLDNNYWWDTGNEGAAIANKTPTEEETTMVVSGSAARLASTTALNLLASGSIFTGEFVKTLMGSTNGALLSFGRPYTCRPSRMKGYYHYLPGKIDKIKPDYIDLEGKTDSCHIYVLLSDNDEPYTINTKEQIFIDFKNDPGIIAFGEHKTDKTTSSYEPFTIELEYRSLTRRPKYVVIVATSSKYGDYFVGSTSSVLYLDEFEFEFD